MCVQTAYLLVLAWSLQTRAGLATSAKSFAVWTDDDSTFWRVLNRYAASVVPDRSLFFQCERTNQAPPASSRMTTTTSKRCNTCRRRGSVAQRSPSFMPTQAKAKHHGQEPANV